MPVVWVVLLGLWWGLAAEGQAATITATSCNNTPAQPHVQTAVNAAANGDTVVIPAGSCTWTVRVLMPSRYFTLQGMGIGVTILTNGITPDGTDAGRMLQWATLDGGLTRITGIEWHGGGIANNFKGLIALTGRTHQLRVDHNKFYPDAVASLYMYDDIWGVFDHNEWVLTPGVIGLYRFTARCRGQVSGTCYGDYNWRDPVNLGSGDLLIFEDNTFTNGGSTTQRGTATDGWSDRTAWRYNNFNCSTWHNHGTESPGRVRGGRQYELYNNNFFCNVGSGNFAEIIDLRSGTGAIFNNTLSMTNRAINKFVALKLERTIATYNIWGKCDGTNVWDHNTSPPGYQCIDQIGWDQGDLLANDPPINTTTGTATWPHQVSTPLYIFGNGPLVDNNNATFPEGIESDTAAPGGWFVQGREYYLTANVGRGSLAARPLTCTVNEAYWATDQGGNWDTTHGGANDGMLYRCTATNTWTAYLTPHTYPHPMVSGSPPPPSDTTPPAAPTNVTVSRLN